MGEGVAFAAVTDNDHLDSNKTHRNHRGWMKDTETQCWNWPHLLSPLTKDGYFPCAYNVSILLTHFAMGETSRQSGPRTSNDGELYKRADQLAFSLQQIYRNGIAGVFTPCMEEQRRWACLAFCSYCGKKFPRSGCSINYTMPLGQPCRDV